MSKSFKLFCIVGLTLLSFSCQKKPSLEHVVQLTPSEWPVLQDELPAEDLLRALDHQLAWFAAHPDYAWQLGSLKADQTRMISTLTRFRDLYQRHHDQPQALEEALRKEFVLYQFRWQGNEPTLITGYHAPVYAGSRTPDATYRFPLYALPDDQLILRADRFDPKVLQKGANARRDHIPVRNSNGEVLPYFTREEIDGKAALAGRDLELVYLKDYFQAFSFHVQGGGFVHLPNGRYLKLNYAGTNGQPYVSIGRVMVNAGKISEREISMQALQAWFAAHPEDLEPVCYQNPSYVFYTSDLVEHESLAPEFFPHGVLNFPVTTRRSIATDKRYFPGGGLAYIKGQQRDLNGDSEPFQAFVLDQDTGGAIRENHVDWFMGAGEQAEHDAGLLKDASGEVYYLLIK